MIFESVIRYFKEKKFYSLALYNGENGIQIDGLFISIKESEELEIEKRLKFEHLEGFFQSANKQYPVVFNFYGHGTTSKKVENKTGYLKKILFRSDPEDFYFYELSRENYMYISMARKGLIDDLLNSFLKNEFYVVDFTIGPFVLNAIHTTFLKSNLLSNYTHKIIYEEDLLSFEEKKKLSSEKFQIEKEELHSGTLPALASFLKYFYNRKNTEVSNSKLRLNQEEFNYRQWFQKFGPIVLGVVLLILVLGHFLKEHYRQRLAELETRSLYIQEQVTQIKNLETEIQNKKEIVRASGFGAIGLLSKYSSQIAHEVPPEIVLNILKVQPLDGRVKLGEKILLQNGIVEIGGTTSDESVFNEWLQELNNKKWVGSLEISNYEYTERNLNTFSIILQIIP